jgi:hypothetical protein
VSEMGLQIWFREDIENSLLAVYTTMQATVTALENDGQSRAYCQGFEDALKCVAMSFGVRLLSNGIVSLPQREHLSSLDS